ncbi:AAA family ATPase [Aliarcobacter butzleri]|uniref:AAA family ATPase n=1 Tax=Aliarcobacter butzleri TaxID=28197 RepID=UPI002B240F81|nr:ATP-binding protein [Aliarcobacter butzleri]
MLLEFGAYNFASFKEGFQVNLREKKNGLEAYTLMGIKGANASGKTNVLKVLSFLATFCRSSFNLKPNQEIMLYSFFKNDRETSIYVIFSENNIEYKYEIDLTKEKVFKESIYRKDKLIIERIENKITENTIDEFKDLKTMILRNNVSIISTVNQYGSKSTEFIYNFFKTIQMNVTPFGLMDKILDHDTISMIYYEEPGLLEFLKEILLKTDTGISNIEIHEMINPETKEKNYFPSFNYDIDGETKNLSYYEQSSGTKALYSHLILYKLTLDMGGILLLDELDINLHPDLIPILLNFFESEKLNPKKAQLIFTTHNNEIMDRLKKSRIVLVNKEDNESYVYKLDETGEILRNDRSISKVYNTGRLGGKPKIELDYE